MTRHRARAWHTLAIGLLSLTSACQRSSGEPSTTETETETGSTGPKETTSSTSDAQTTGQTTGDEVDQTICEEYIACIIAVAPESLPAAQAGFGENGTCWQGGPTEAQQCLDACTTGTATFHEAFPEEPACFTCTANEDCQPGETCFQGGCEVGCGNGVVDPGEYCDSQLGCYQDCDGPGICGPLNNVGCEEGEVCLVGGPYEDESVSGISCFPQLGAVVGLGEECGTADCQPGLKCLYGEDVGCATELCCAQLCDVNAVDTCTQGTQCTALHGYPPLPYNLPNWARYLGACVLPG